jgi:ABC-type transport system involved in Fe-S cluster assembly fused permease/ATPase subunit
VYRHRSPLYDDLEALVLDEATPVLDTETEQKIMDEIYSVSTNKTLLVIAHCLSTVERCDRKIRIGNGRIVEGTANQPCIKNRILS